MESKKIYWSISEVAQLSGVDQNTLRFWETEFNSVLKPARNRGNRVYVRKDIEVVEKIKYLLYEERSTIEGAVKKMKKLKSIPLESYKKMSNLILDREFCADFEEFCEALRKIFPKK